MSVSCHMLGVYLSVTAVQPIYATTMYKVPICAAQIREVAHSLGDTCVVEQATYQVVQTSNGIRKLELMSLSPTEKLKTWAICVGENWSKWASSKHASLGENVSIQLKLGECGS